MPPLGFVAVFLLVGCLASIGGCGSGGGGASATCAAPCGGNIVGDWTFGEPCIDVPLLTAAVVAECPQAVVTAAGAEVTGTLAFRADATFEIAHAETLSYKFDVPASAACWGAATCADLDVALRLQDDSFACSGTSTCTCTFMEPSNSLSETGTYTISGTTLMTTSNGTRTWSYCASADNLTFRASFVAYRARKTGG